MVHLLNSSVCKCRANMRSLFVLSALGCLALLQASEDTIFAAEKNVEYKLNRELREGDVIKAWGVYRDHSTSKFSVNIRSSSALYQLHVDFRPYNDVCVMNNYRDGSWKQEVRPAFSRSKFTADTLFEVKIVVGDANYRVYFNGEELTLNFPRRDPINQANHVVLHGGSNGFQWKALQLPESYSSGSVHTNTNARNDLSNTLAVGDVISAWGIYASGSSKFSVNLRNEQPDEYMIHVDFRPPPHENKVVLNSLKAGVGWQQELRTTLPSFQNGQVFRVDVHCLESEFEIYHDGNVLGRRFPYRDGFSLDEVTWVSLEGGSEGMKWTDVQLPRSELSIAQLPVISVTSKVKLVSASQSSEGWDGHPDRAIDGNTNGHYWGLSCTHTERGARVGNWWEAWFETRSAVDQVVIYNRNDPCCSFRIDNALVYVGDELCGAVNYVEGQQVFSVSCGGAIGDRVRVMLDGQALTLCEVEVYGVPTEEEPLVRVGVGMPVKQVSNGINIRRPDGNAVPANALDSSIRTCTSSPSARENMWQVDLLDKWQINKIIIWDRLAVDHLSTIDGLEVYASNELCGEPVRHVLNQPYYIVECGDMVARSVKLIQHSNRINLCEVEILAYPSERTLNKVNVARSGIATQDSTGWDGVASRAIDGNSDGDYFGGETCSHNGALEDGWWNLELPEPTPVKLVVIYNRQDCCQDRIDGVEVLADDVLCRRITYIEDVDVYKVVCDDDTHEYLMATNIRIRAAEGQYLTLCEVEVLTDPEALNGDNLVNLAYLKPTSQSTTGWGGVPERAVDGRESGHYFNGETCTHTNSRPDQWWSVDLGAKYVVEKIVIKNRVDCCRDRINGVQVFVGGVQCGEAIQYDPYKSVYHLTCEGGIVGNSVTINNYGSNPLTLCEVKVYGDDTVIQDDTDQVVEGDVSGDADDDRSEATCPPGYMVNFCEVKSGGVSTQSDGAYTTLGGSKCVAVNAYGGNGAKAKAVCSQNVQVPDPCNGPSLPRFIHLEARNSEPSVSCPAGYNQVLCNAHSPWKSMLRDKGIQDNGIILNDQPCQISGCSDRNWCRVTAICRVNENSEEYAAAVCSSCEGWHCGSGEECVMADIDDDPSDLEPTCVEIQTGCDGNTRCGDGDCIPEGRSDFTCDCADGFRYNEVAKVCSPVSTIWDTVYGDPGYGDDASSHATCPLGKYVMRCMTHGAPSAADGVIVENDKIEGTSSCVAKASHVTEYPVVAVAYCGPRVQIANDPCGDTEPHYSVEYRKSVGSSPAVSCPPGYTMESSVFYSSYAQEMSDEVRSLVTSIGSVAISADGSSSIDQCVEEGKDCLLTAICHRFGDTNDYRRAVCSTCENMSCGDGMECVLDEDDLPVCEERIPGGCEVEPCGQGICNEFGANYTCTCNSGYFFNSQTCEDINECANLPCGNGECINTPGSHSCNCLEGYELSGGTCVDIDECVQDNSCLLYQRCSNTDGSYECDCLDTFVTVQNADNTESCTCADGYETRGTQCMDIDECARDDICGVNEDCINSPGNYRCVCSEGFELGLDGVCKTFIRGECGVEPKNDDIRTMPGKRVQVRLRGELKKTWKKYAEITWEKNNELWDPKTDGKERFNGFTIRDFQADDVGTYVGSIFIEISETENYKCSVQLSIGMIEGSASMEIKNRDELIETMPAGKGQAIICDVTLKNVDLEDANSPDNVDWYKVDMTNNELVKIEDNDAVNINKKRGTYRLWFISPAAEDSGTYRCAFDRDGVQAYTDVSVIWA